NGVGFQPEAPAPAGHYGLAHLRERAARLGGTVTIGSQSGQGTRVVLLAPLRRRLRRRVARRPDSPARA
ncbi:MAG: sensor histidine kinase, partial [Thermaerobacter sp.]|nr:sensor histidine kinase [Thermaerobacter sp.]